MWAVSLCGSYPADCAAAEYVFMTISLETIKTAITVFLKKSFEKGSEQQAPGAGQAECGTYFPVVVFSNITRPVLHSDQCRYFCV